MNETSKSISSLQNGFVKGKIMNTGFNEGAEQVGVTTDKSYFLNGAR